MRNIGKLRSAGFKIDVATDAVNCTDISHPEMFYWFRHHLVTSPARLESSICPASKLLKGGYGFTLAGSYSDNAADLPCTLMTSGERSEVRALYQAAEDAKAEAEVRENAYLTKVNQIVHGMN